MGLQILPVIRPFMVSEYLTLCEKHLNPDYTSFMLALNTDISCGFLTTKDKNQTRKRYIPDKAWMNGSLSLTC